VAPWLGPGDLPVAGHEHEQVLARPTPYDHRLDDGPRRHARAAAASAKERTLPCRVIQCSIPASVRAWRAGVSSGRSTSMDVTLRRLLIGAMPLLGPVAAGVYLATRLNQRRGEG